MKRFAQMPPGGDMGMPPMGGGAPEGAPPMDMGMPPMGMPPMGMPPMGMGGPPMGGGAVNPMSSSGPNREEIGSPLDSIGKIMYDFNVVDVIAEHPDWDAPRLAEEIWEAYGGNVLNQHEEKPGAREERKDVSPEEEEKEQDRTEESRWERLPKGKTISDVASLKELRGMVTSLIKSAVTPAKSPEGGMGMPMASIMQKALRLAHQLDHSGLHEMADDVFSACLKETTAI